MVKDLTQLQNLGILPSFDGWVFLYELVDPETNEVRYVGKSNNPRLRYKNHISNYHLKSATHKNNWIKSLKNKNLLPIMRIINFCKPDVVNDLEIKKIKELRDSGINLTNMTDGGDGITNHSEEVRQKIRDGVKGIKRPPCSEKTKDKIRKANLGVSKKPWTEERLKRHSKPIIGVNLKTKESKEFCSIREAARVLNLDAGHISKCCKKNTRLKTIGGWSWEYKEMKK